MRLTVRLGMLSCVALSVMTAVFLAATPHGRSDPGAGEKGAPAKAVKLPGQVEAAEQTEVFSRIVGFVQRVNVGVGDRVKKGQALAELAVPELEADLKAKEALAAEAEEEVHHAELVLQETRATLAGGIADVTLAEIVVKQAQATLRTAKAAYDQAVKQRDAKTGDAAAVEDKAQLVEAATAAAEEAEIRVQVAKASRDAVEANVAASEATIKVAKAHRDSARADAQRQAAMVGYAKVVAPFDGVVTHRAVDVGAYAGPPNSRVQALLTVARTDTVRVAVAVPETEAARVRVGTEAVVELAALPGRPIKGTVTRTAGALDPEKHSLRAEVDLPNKDGDLLPGSSASVTLTLAQP
jgi:multidrug efflux pump subunit AcrA (membrane-fusion protein)